MNDTVKRYLLSSVSTFVSSALTVLAIQVSSGSTIEWTATWWLAAVLVAARAGVKSVVERMSGTTGDKN